MITRAKVDSVHNRREASKFLYEKDVIGKLFSEIGPRNASRNGGYTRILKMGTRNNDAAQLVILELVEKEQVQKNPLSKR
jgi:large subunit ribosomal protein L17